jgi:Baseplate J-like protein
MSRGKIVPPNLDDRTWQDIVNQAKSLIPKYAPEWTDHNPSDLGIALIELFAWIVEGMTYRLNRVPEKNYIEFLNLLGITRDPATPASAFLTYRLASGSAPVIVPKGTQTATQPTDKEEGIVFEADRDLRVLPINLVNALYIRRDGTTKYKNVTANLVAPPLSGLTIDIPAGEQITLALGFDLASTENISLLCRFSKPVKKEPRPFTAVRTQANMSAATAGTNQAILASAADAPKFQAGDIVQLRQDPKNDRATIASVSGTTITFTANLANTYTSGATIRIADLIPGQNTIRLNSTAGIDPNATLRITQGTTTELVIVQSIASNIITLKQGLAKNYTQNLNDVPVNLQTNSSFLDVGIVWLYSSGTLLPTAWSAIPAANISDGTDTFQKNGTVSFSVPTTWASQNPQTWSASIPPDSPADQINQPLFWIGVRLTNGRSQPLQVVCEHFLFNSVSATNALTITQPELLGTSNGQPFQFFELKNTPLFKSPGAKDPYDHLVIQVRSLLVGGGFGDWTTWVHLDDFPEGAGNYYRLNPVTGKINFGNFLTPDGRGNGSIPPTGSEIRAFTYRYVVGGIKGNVPSGTITIIRTPISGITSVTNLGAATGGADEEEVEETKRRAPDILRNRYRAVTVEDYEYLAREASTKVEKVRCLPPRQFSSYDKLPAGAAVGDPWTYGGLNRSLGNVNVIIIPEAPLSIPAPIPSEDLLQEVSDYLEARRPVTTLLQVTYPRYLPINVQGNIKVWQRALDIGLVTSTAQVQDDIIAKIKKFLHPLLGGVDGMGWEIGQEIVISTLFEFIQPVPDVGFISDLKVAAAQPLYQPPARPYDIGIFSVWVQVADYEMICNGTHTITVDILRT